MRPGEPTDQGDLLSALLDEASATNLPLFLAPGDYRVSGVTLPRRTRIAGVAGATRLSFAGGSHFIAGRHCELVELGGLVLDGAGQPWRDDAAGLLDIRHAMHVAFDNCRILGATRNALVLERVSGRVERCEISGAADAGLWTIDAGGLRITGNVVHDCGNGGILVHRWEAGEDGSIVSGNRIERIGARAGGTGQNGNGINVFKAGNVIVSDNQVSDCAFSAIRANGGSNVQIRGNTCLRSGETAIYSEFVFEGASIVGNIVDGAANGISVVNFNEGGRLAIVSGNIVRNLSSRGPYPADPPGFGIGISVEADTSVTGNVVEGAPLSGINLGWGPYLRNVAVTGNIIRDAGEGISVSVVEGAGPAVISDNVIDGARRGAIVGHRWSEAVTGDLALEGSTRPGLAITGNRVN